MSDIGSTIQFLLNDIIDFHEALERTSDIDDRMTEDDLNSHRRAMQEYRSGETVSHGEIDWK